MECLLFDRTFYCLLLIPSGFATGFMEPIPIPSVPAHRGFFQRSAGPLLMLGGGAYLAVNVLNGAFYELPITDRKNLRRIGAAVGAFGLGYLLKKLFASDGFSKKGDKIVYVDL